MVPNLPEAFEAHFGVPMAGAVLNAMNIRLDPETIAFILRHGEAKVLITDTEFSPVIRDALARLEAKPLVIDIADAMGPGGDRLGEMDYEAFLASGDPEFPRMDLRDRRDALYADLRAFVADAGADLAPRLRDELWPVVEAYEAAKRRTGCLDFNDLLYFALLVYNF